MLVPRDPVYTLQGAIERIKDILPNKDSEQWLRDQIAADRIRWAYRWIKEERGRQWPTFIDLPPRASIMEEPDLEIDWSKGVVIVQRRHNLGISASKIRKKLVECGIVVSRRDLDRELENITSSEPVKFTTPYLKFMTWVSKEMGLDENAKVLKKNIVGFIQLNWTPELGEFSTRMAEQMATFLRQPEHRKGGYVTQTPKTKGDTL